MELWVGCEDVERFADELGARANVELAGSSCAQWGEGEYELSWVDGPSEASAALLLEDVLEGEGDEVVRVSLQRELSPRAIVSLLIAGREDAEVAQQISRAGRLIDEIPVPAGSSRAQVVAEGLISNSLRSGVSGALIAAWERACEVVVGAALSECDEVDEKLPAEARELAAIACELTGLTGERGARVEDVVFIMEAVGSAAAEAAACLLVVE